jgi:hypothetical protein
MSIDLIKDYITEVSKLIAFDPNENQIERSKEFNQKELIDMTDLSTSESLTKVLNNVSDSTYIHYINTHEYKNKKSRVPTLSISGFQSTGEPMGIYAYPFKKEDIKNLFRQFTSKDPKNRIAFTGQPTGLNRDYFILFKVKDSSNKLNVSNKKEGIINYVGNYEKDIKTIIHTFLIYVLQTLEESSSEFNYLINTHHGLFTEEYFENEDYSTLKNPNYSKNNLNKEKIISNLKKVLNKNIKTYFGLLTIHDIPEEFYRWIKKYLYYYVIAAKSIEHLKKENVTLENMSVRTLTDDASNILYHSLKKLTKNISIHTDFSLENTRILKLYSMILILQQVRTDITLRQGSDFITILLNSIGIDSIEQVEGGLLHNAEQNQAVFTNLDNVEYIGTFNNIFKPDSSEFSEVKDLISKRYASKKKKKRK